MKVRIDNAGRIVVPKPVRERLGLHAGSDLDMEESAEGLVLRVNPQQPSMIRVDGFWVHQGAAPSGFDWERWIEREREQRLHEVSGF